MERDRLIKALVGYELPLATLQAELAAHPWDWFDEPLATLRRGHVVAVLRRWIAGELDDEEVEEWANLVEVRDDLEHDPDDAEVRTAIFDLANPLLEGPVHKTAPAILAKLS